MANSGPLYSWAWSARWGRELGSSFLRRDGRSSVDVEGSSFTLLSVAPGVWELMALRLSRWYGAPELSSSAGIQKKKRAFHIKAASI